MRSRTSATSPPALARSAAAPASRRLAPLLHAEGAGRGRRPDRPWNYPLLMTTWEARARARRRLRRRPETRSADAGDCAAARRARGRGRFPRRCDQPRHRRRPLTGAYLVEHPGVDKVSVHRLDEDRRRDHAALLGSDQAPDARARGQEPESRLRRRRPRLGDPERGPGRSTMRPARAVRRAPTSSSSSRSTTTSSARSPRRRGN